MDYFNLKEHNTTLKNEILSGITLFVTMAYILQVNPQVLSQAGMSMDGVFISTVIASVIATLIAGFYAKLPFALAPGLGINSFFVYHIVKQLHFSWPVGMLAVYASGAIFILVLKLNWHEILFNAIPDSIKLGIVSGLGLAIFILGLEYSGLIEKSGSTYSIGISNPTHVILFLIGLLVTLYAYSRKIVGAIFYGIASTYLLSLVLKVVGDGQLAVSDFIALPNFSEFFTVFLKFPDPAEIFCSPNQILSFLGLVIILFFTHFFDISGTLFGLSTQLAESGRRLSKEDMKKALYTDAVGSIVSATVGTSTVTTYAECSAGIVSGAKTGITSLVVAAGFALSLVFSPIFLSIEGYTIAPALMIAGVLLVKNIFTINYKDLTEALPSLVVMIAIGLTFQLFYATLIGVVLYIGLKLVAGRRDEIYRFTYFILVIAVFVSCYYFLR